MTDHHCEPHAPRRQTTVMIADDHPIYRQGLARMVKNRHDLSLVSAAEDGRDAISQIEALRPDVAVVDLRMPGLTGIEIASVVSQGPGETRIILLTGHGLGVAYDALGAGVSAVLSKTADPEAICDAITAVGRGGSYVDPEFHSSLAHEINSRSEHAGPLLSARERDVLELVAEGLAVTEIGKRLHLSAATVKTHLQHLYRKLEVNDRSAAVAVGLRRGLIS